MILLGLVLAAALFLGAAALGGSLPAYLDTSSLFFVLICILLYIVFGRKGHFATGLKAVWRQPETGNPEIAAYFRQLSVWTLGVGVAGMVGGLIGGICLMKNPNVIGSPVAVGLLTFFYAGWITVLLFLPIANRFSVEPPVESETVPPFRFPIASTLLVLAAYFLMRASMALVILAITTSSTAQENGGNSVQMKDVVHLAQLTVLSFNPADLGDEITDIEYMSSFIYWDSPSYFIIVFSISAFRIAAGKIRNRFDWVPVSILYGVLWSITGVILMLCDLDPQIYVSGCLVALLTTFYGMIAAVILVLDKSGTCCKIILFSSFVVFLIPLFLLAIWILSNYFSIAG